MIVFFLISNCYYQIIVPNIKWLQNIAHCQLPLTLKFNQLSLLDLALPVAAVEGLVHDGLYRLALDAVWHHALSPGMRSRGVKALHAASLAEGVFGGARVERVGREHVGSRDQLEVVVGNDEVVILFHHANGATEIQR